MLLKLLAGVATALVVLSSSAFAAPFGYVVEGGGTAQVYQLNNGNFLGLLGFDTRNAAQTGGTITTADLDNGIISGTAVDYYFGSSSLNGSASEFDQIVGSLSLANGERYFNALWVEWTGGTLVLSNGKGGTGALAANVSLDGDPITPVPLPAALPMMLAAIGGFAYVTRRRSSKAA